MKETQNKIAVFTGIGIGEETKGNAVEWSSRQLEAHTVWRSGGCQSGHHIIKEDGREQVFSHFGAATLDGVRTHLKHMVISPVELFNEACEIEEKGIENPFGMITIDQDCISITPFHGAISRLREVLRGVDKKGTIGMGVGDAIKDSKDPTITIRAGDFKQDEKSLKEKVEAIRQHKIKQANALIFGKDELPEKAYEELEILYNQDLVDTTVKSFKYADKLFQIVDDKYLEELLKKDGAIVCETSHGALLHPWYGFLPHSTQIDPTSQDILQTLKKLSYSGELIRIGVSRCYMTRHGAGPLVSFNEEMTQNIHETHNNAKQEWNDWLGGFRNGNYDIVAMKYALAISGGRNSFDGLMISYMDLLSTRDEWQVCEAYEYTGDTTNLEDYFELNNGLINGIKVYPNTKDDAHLRHQQRLTELLKKCKPVLKTIKTDGKRKLEEVFIDYVESELEVPVVAVSYGPKMGDRKARPGYEHLFQR